MINLKTITFNRNVNITEIMNITHKILKTETPRVIIHKIYRFSIKFKILIRALRALIKVLIKFETCFHLWQEL